MSVGHGTKPHHIITATPAGVTPVWVAPVALGLLFAVLWPAAGYPWWPPVLVLALLLLARLLGLLTVVAPHRRATLIAAALILATGWAVAPWLVALAGGVAAAVWAVLRVPRRGWVAGVGVALAVGAGLGWALDTAATAHRSAAADEQIQAFNRAQLLPGDARHVMGEVMALVADDDPALACALFTPSAQQQLATAYRAPDCQRAIQAWHALVTRPVDYRLSPQLRGEHATLAADRQTGALIACGLEWTSAITGPQPPPGPDSPGRMQLHRVLGQGFEITAYTSC